MKKGGEKTRKLELAFLNFTGTWSNAQQNHDRDKNFSQVGQRYFFLQNVYHIGNI